MSAERAFISVTDKTNLVEFAKDLANYYELLATRGTSMLLAETGIQQGSIRQALRLTLNLSREGLARVIAENVKKEEKLRPIGLVCIGIKPLPARPELSDRDIGGPLILSAALESRCPALSRPEQYLECIDRLRAGEFFDADYQAHLAEVAREEVSSYADKVAEQFGVHELKVPGQ